MSVRRELASGVFYTSIAKYAGIVVTLVVTGILSRLFTPEQFGVVNIATVVIAFFAIFSDLGIGPAVIQHKNLDRHDLGGIFSLSVWSGAVMALLFFAAAGTIASLYGDSQVLRNVLRILALNLFFAAANIVPNALILKEKRFRFAAMRSLTVQIAGGTAAIAAAYAGAGIYALTINPVFSSLMLLAINYRQNPLPLRLRPGRKALGKVFSFSAYQFSFQLINYFSRNLDKLLMGRYMSLSQLGYYDKSYRLMMLPLQNIAYVISPVMHPIFSEMQHDLKQLGASYLKVVRLLAFIGLPLSAVLTTDAVYAAFYDDDAARGFLHSHSYTGNPLACRAAVATLELFEQLDPLAANRQLARKISAAFAGLNAHPRVSNARQQGMIWAWDIDTALPDFAQRYHQAALDLGLLLRPIGRTLYCMPPYVLDDADIVHLGQAALAALNTALQQEAELAAKKAEA